MNTIKGEIKEELLITKSTFITYLKNVTSVSDAKEYLQSVKVLHPDASHHVCAYTIGKTGEYGHSSDDGEPSGTAGLPVLDVFRKNNLTNYVCVVVRYFGGVKLGAGGLVRAYSKSASNALFKMEIIPIIDYTKLLLSFDYAYLDLLENRLKDYSILQKSFSHNISMLIEIPLLEKDYVINNLYYLTNGLIKISIPEEN